MSKNDLDYPYNLEGRNAPGTWEKEKGIPLPNAIIEFKNSDGDWLKGTYLLSERMFFLGFQDSGEFLFHSDVKDWRYINDNV